MTLVVVDGTWSQAKTVVRDNPVLQALPRYAFATPEPSQYRIRREPNDAYVSTIEALMHVLGVLEGDPERFRALLAPLDAMVEAQLVWRGRSPRRTYRSQARRSLRVRLPETIRERFDDLVCVVAEANAWPYRVDQGQHPDELVQWLAFRPATGETFEGLAAPGALSPSTTFHTELDEAELLAAPPLASLIERFDRFVRPGDVIAAWGHYGPDLYVAAGGSLPAERVDLREVAQRLVQKKPGAIETYTATLGPIPELRGRGRRRLAMLRTIISAWHALE